MDKTLNINNPFYVKWNVSYNLDKFKNKNNEEYYELSKKLALIDLDQINAENINKNCFNPLDISLRRTFKNPFETTINLNEKKSTIIDKSLFDNGKFNFNTQSSKTSNEIIEELDKKIFTGETIFNQDNNKILEEKIKLIGFHNLNKILTFVKSYPNLEDFLNDYLKMVLNIPFLKIKINSEKETIGPKDLIEIEILHLKKYNYLNIEFPNKNNILKINLFSSIFQINSTVNIWEKRKDLLRFLSLFKNKTYKNNQLKLFTSNLFNPLKNIKGENHLRSDDVFPINCLSLDFNNNGKDEREKFLYWKLDELGIGDIIPEEIKRNFIEYKINENTFEYIYCYFDYYCYFDSREKFLFLYIKSENNKITEIETGYLNHNKFSRDEFDWDIEKVLYNSYKLEELNSTTYEDFIKAKDELKEISYDY